MTWDGLAQAVLNLCPPGTVLGEAPATAELPWMSLSVAVPQAVARSESTTTTTAVLRAQVLVAAATDSGALSVAHDVHDALEDARPVAAGWVCGPLLQVGSSRPYQVPAVVLGTDRRVTCVPVAFEATVSRA